MNDGEPLAWFIPGFSDSAFEYPHMPGTEFVDQSPAQHKLRKRIFKRFKEEEIDIPFPHRTVYLREEKDLKR